MRRVEPMSEDQREGVFALHARVFGAAKGERFRRRFEWQYVRNPFVREGQVTNWILTSDGEVVGHLGAVPVDFRVGTELVHGSWICDYMADVSHRFGPELASLRASASTSSELPAGYGMPDHVALSYEKLRWTRLAVGSFLVKLLKLRGVTGLRELPGGRDRASRARALRRRAATLPRWCRHYLAGRSTRPRGGGEVSLCAGFDESLDGVWRRAAGAHPVCVDRSRAYLGWRYRGGGPPGARVVVAGGGQGPRGVAVIEKVRWRGIVVGLLSELIAEGEDDAADLLAFVETRFREENVAAIVTEGFPRRLRSVLARSGFTEVGGGPENVTVFDRFDRCPSGVLGDADNWLLTPGDSDRSLGYPRVPWKDG